MCIRDSIWVIRNHKNLDGSAFAAWQERDQVQLTPRSYDYMHRIKASAYRVTRTMQSSTK